MIKTKPKLAVLLATFNGEAYLDEQLSSLKNQLDIQIKVVASDDISSDQTIKLLSRTCDPSFRISILPSEKLGNAATNFFRLLRDADLTSIDYVALSDQDDIWDKDKLSRAVQKMLEHTVDGYSSNVTAFWSNGKQKLINKAQPQQPYDYMFESAGPGCTFVVTKGLALELQAFLIENEEKCQSIALHDWFIYAYARSNEYKWFIDHTPHMLYRQHAENVVGANVGLKAKFARWKKLRDGWLVEQALLIANTLGYSNAVPMQKLMRYNFLDRLWLILNVTKLRRRLRDRVALVLFLLMPLKR